MSRASRKRRVMRVSKLSFETTLKSTEYQHIWRHTPWQPSPLTIPSQVRERVVSADVIVITEFLALYGRGPTMLLASRARGRNPHGPAHTGRQRRRRRRRRRSWRGRRIISVPDLRGNIALAVGHPIPGVANTHVPIDIPVGPTLRDIQGLPWAPVIWAVALTVDHRRARRADRLGGTCAQPQTGQPQTARHQHSRG